MASVVREALRQRPGDVVGVLQAIQAACGYLPKPALALLAAETGRSLAQLYGVISFYATFSLERRGRVVIRVCQGTACHVRGAARVTEALAQHLHIEPGDTTEDFEFTLETVACLGCCSLAPVVTVAGHTHGRVDGPHAVAALAQVTDFAEDLL
ncbi:MAG: NAD(P)H-dependent oxidoreductase subunit E [Deltaproteobacteria bacterium]|nr:NAD(P)H-dependent oxidoreductase subunit E [Deltaproteobacteria bacterium]